MKCLICKLLKRILNRAKNTGNVFINRQKRNHGGLIWAVTVSTWDVATAIRDCTAATWDVAASVSAFKAVMLAVADAMLAVQPLCGFLCPLCGLQQPLILTTAGEDKDEE